MTAWEARSAPALKRTGYADPCAYCGMQSGIHRDHVVPQSLKKTHRTKYDALPAQLKATVWACLSCNLLKGTRKLVPPSWAERIPLLKEHLPGPWRVWSGGLDEDAYRETWV